MEAEILSSLQNIETAIYWLIAIVALGVIANWVRAGIGVKNIINNALDDLFTEEASNYYDEGKLDDLLTHPL